MGRWQSRLGHSSARFTKPSSRRPGVPRHDGRRYGNLYARRNAYYIRPMIKSFADKVTAALFSGRRVRRLPPAINRRA